MSKVQAIADLLNILPDEDIKKINKYMKEHIKACNPDYIKTIRKGRIRKK